MDKKQIQEKARNIGRFTLEVLDDLFGKRVLMFVYVLAAVFAASASLSADISGNQDLQAIGQGLSLSGGPALSAEQK